MLTRRRLIQSGLTTAAAASFGPTFWRTAFAAQPAKRAPVGPYGWLRPADANGIMLPPRFSSRVIARSTEIIPGTGYRFPAYPDGAATFGTGDGGWILAVNSEIPGGLGGASGIRFAADGRVTAAYSILTGTSTNCAGGPAPWGAWLSCEEVPNGRVWECDVKGVAPAVPHSAMGHFQHEAACVDADHQHVYLSEDVDGGGLYRFTPTVYPDLSAGVLEIACPGVGNKVVWKVVNDPTGAVTPTRSQVPDSIKFRRGEGIWFDSGFVYLVTTTDETVHVYDTNAATLGIVYKAADVAGTPLLGIDNILATESGDLMVAEDSYSNDPDAMDVCLITQNHEVSRFLKITGNDHFLPTQSEVVSIAMSPDGTRMYVASQRYKGTGQLYEISGPFRPDQATIFADIPEPTPVPTASPTATRTPTPTATPTPPPPKPTPGVPIGLEVTKRMAEKTFIRNGLALGFTLDKAASVRVRVTAKVGNRTKTLATVNRSAKSGRSMWRIKASTSGAKLLRSRRKDVKATVEIRVTTPGAPVRTFKRTVTLRQ